MRKRRGVSIHRAFQLHERSQANRIDWSSGILSRLRDLLKACLAKGIDAAGDGDDCASTLNALHAVQSFYEGIIKVGFRKTRRIDMMENTLQGPVALAETSERLQFVVIFENCDLVVATDDVQKFASRSGNLICE